MKDFVNLLILYLISMFYELPVWIVSSKPIGWSW